MLCDLWVKAVMKFLIEKMTPQEITDALREIDTFIVPLGSLEQHGLHLPFGTDAIISITVLSV